MHLLQSVLHDHGRRSSVRVGCHNPHHRTSRRIQTSGDNPENDILTGENTGNLGNCVTTTDAANSGGTSVGLHDTDSSSASLLHEPGGFSDSSSRGDSRRSGAGVNDSGQVGKSHSLSESLDVSKHGSSLRIVVQARTKFGLNAGQSGRKLIGSGRTTLDFGESFVEDFGNVEKTDNVTILVANRLYGR